MIYFALADAPVSRVKIGWSRLVSMRIVDLSSWCPVPLTVLCEAEGSRAAEGHIHNLLQAHRVHGEWFSAHPDVLALASHIDSTGDIPGLDPSIRNWSYAGIPVDAMSYIGKCGLSLDEASAYFRRSKGSILNWRNGFPSFVAQAALDLLKKHGVSVAAEEMFPSRKPEGNCA
jgi:hypothetical protein